MFYVFMMFVIYFYTFSLPITFSTHLHGSIYISTNATNDCKSKIVTLLLLLLLLLCLRYPTMSHYVQKPAHRSLLINSHHDDGALTHPLLAESTMIRELIRGTP